jgi:hypothetical protein
VQYSCYVINMWCLPYCTIQILARPTPVYNAHGRNGRWSSWRSFASLVFPAHAYITCPIRTASLCNQARKKPCNILLTLPAPSNPIYNTQSRNSSRNSALFMDSEHSIPLRILFSGMWWALLWRKFTDISGENIASISGTNKEPVTQVTNITSQKRRCSRDKCRNKSCERTNRNKSDSEGVGALIWAVCPSTRGGGGIDRKGVFMTFMADLRVSIRQRVSIYIYVFLNGNLRWLSISDARCWVFYLYVGECTFPKSENTFTNVTASVLWYIHQLNLVWLDDWVAWINNKKFWIELIAYFPLKGHKWNGKWKKLRKRTQSQKGDRINLITLKLKWDIQTVGQEKKNTQTHTDTQTAR